MFTGIIQDIGTVAAVDAAPGGVRVVIQPSAPLAEMAEGESIAIEGVCLTVEPSSKADRLEFYLSDETLSKTTHGTLKPGARVNMERALAAKDRLGGHLVMGHVDGVGKIRRLDQHGEGWDLEVECPESIRAFVAPKGSVSIDGISLTPVDVTADSFTVAIIPHTYEKTTLCDKRKGSPVNLEADMIARYVVRYLSQAASGGGLDLDFLRRAGFDG